MNPQWQYVSKTDEAAMSFDQKHKDIPGANERICDRGVN